MAMYARALVPAEETELRVLHGWLDSWRGVGDVARGMERQDSDLQRTSSRPMGRIVMALIMMVCLVLPVAAHAADSDILSKDDARQLFAMSKRQWEENI